MSHKNVLLLMVTAANLRLSVTAVTPLFALIRRGLHVNSVITSLLVTLPLICFALGALFAPQLIHQFGLKHTLISVDSLLLLGNMLRPFGQVQLVLGTS